MNIILNNLNTKKSIIAVALLLLLLCTSSFAAPTILKASIDRDTISIVETVKLQLQATELPLLTFSEPDFSSLDDDFQVVSQSVSHSIQNINGVSSRGITWNLVLQPKRVGELLIPSFSVAGVQSNRLPIQVEKEQLSTIKEADFSLKLLANKQTAIPHEQVIITLRFSFSQQVSQLQNSELVLDNAQVIKLEDKSYETRINGRQFGVYEISYAVFANQAGELLIPAQNIQVRLGRNSIFRQQTGKSIALQSAGLSVNIIQPPTSKQRFIIADSLQLQDSWTGSDTLILGDAITREIRLTLKGAQAATITALTMDDMVGVKIYPEVAEKKEYKTSEGIETFRTRRFAIVPTKVGEYVVPAMDIRWWNGRESKFATASLAAKTIQVISAAKTVGKAPQEEIKPELQSVPVMTARLEKVLVKNPLNQWLLGLCLLLAMTVLLLLLLLWKTSRGQQRAKLPILLKNEVKEEQLFTLLLQSLTQNNPRLIHQCLQRWATFMGIEDWRDPSLQTSVQYLERQLYAAEQDQPSWNKVEFTQQIKKLRKTLRREAAMSNNLGNQSGLYPKFSGEQ